MKNPLLPPLLALCAGILVARTVWFDGPELVYALAAFCLFALLSRGWVRFVSCYLALFAAGAWTTELHRLHQRPELDVANGERAVLEGCVVEPSVFSEGREQFTLELGEHARARVSLYLKETDAGIDLPYGTVVRVAGKVRTPRNFLNPGTFDYSGYLARQDIFWTASASGSSAVSRLSGRCGSWFWNQLFSARMGSIRRLESLYKGDEYTTGMMEAMLLGESSRLQKVWTESFRRTGTYHAIVISGIHVSVLAGLVLFFCRLLPLPQTAGLVLSCSAAWLYALVCGWQPPVVRSAGGFTLFLIARLFYRRGRLLNILAAVALVYLLFDPGAVWDASFQLSFLSVLAIGALVVPLLERTSIPRSRALRGLGNSDIDLHFEPALASFRIEMRLIAETFALACNLPLAGVATAWAFLLRFGLFLYETVVTSAIIQVGLALPMILYFHRISFSGLSANVVVVPILTAAVPVGFSAILTGWYAPAWVAKAMLHVAEVIAAWHMRFESDWRVPDPPPWLALLFVGCLVCVAVFQSSRWTRRLGSVAVLACFGALYFAPIPTVRASGGLDLMAIDVGQGDSMLLRLPDGRHMLVDTGGIVSFGTKRKPNLDIGEDVVSPILWKLGITQIDVLAISHWHDDHCGGARAIIQNFHPKEIWSGANPLPLDVGIPVRIRTAGETFWYGGAQFAVLAPFADHPGSDRPGNNDSLVLKVVYGAHSFLLTGDIERAIESRILAEMPPGKVNVLKVAHHGSKTSTEFDWLDAVRPQFALISVGEANMYRLPHPAVVRRLQDAHAAVYRTDEFGFIRIHSDGRRFSVSTYQTDPRADGMDAPFSPDW